jgi:hypothetical protein
VGGCAVGMSTACWPCACVQHVGCVCGHVEFYVFMWVEEEVPHIPADRGFESLLDHKRDAYSLCASRAAAVCCATQAEAAKAAELRGPHTFSLSRLLTVYSSLLAADEGSSGGSSGGGCRPWQQSQQQEAERGAGLMASAGWMGVHRSDVLMGVNTLVASRLMSQVGQGWAWQQGPDLGVRAF